MSAATSHQVLQHIERGSNLDDIASLTHWPARQILLLVARHGYLPSAGCGLCKPPGHDKRSLPAQNVRSSSGNG
jgi:hypothetical protein